MFPACPSWVKNAPHGTSAFKCKLFPPGHLQECKARLWDKRDVQIEGIYYFEIFVPVVQKSTVQALLIKSLALRLETSQIDFSNALFQAEIAEETFV
jgi:hypothetical protein